MNRLNILSSRNILFLIFIPLFFTTGCLNTRGAMYLHPERVNTYLSREIRPKKPKPREAYIETALIDARQLLKKVPDANRILGGFCTKLEIINVIRDIYDYAPACRKKLAKYQQKSNFHGTIFWSLLGATTATGIVAILGGTMASKASTRTGLALGFGIPMALFALTNGFGPFQRWQAANKDLAKRIDNYMWSMRKRISSEVCNAPSFEDALIQIRLIRKRFRRVCLAKQDNGIFKPGETTTEE